MKRRKCEYERRIRGYENVNMKGYKYADMKGEKHGSRRQKIIK